VDVDNDEPTPLAAADSNAEKGMSLRSGRRTFVDVLNNGTDRELLESLVALIHDAEEEEQSVSTTTTMTTAKTTTEGNNRKRSYKYSKQTVTIGKNTILDVPNNVECVLKNRLSCLIRESNEYRRIKAALSYKKYSWEWKAGYLLGCGFVKVPKGRHYALEQALPLFYKALLVQANVHVPDETIATSTPSSKTIGELVTRAAATLLASLQSVVQKAKSFALACDKGHRHGVDHLSSCFRFTISWRRHDALGEKEDSASSFEGI